jgi:hypothetical protein
LVMKKGRRVGERSREDCGKGGEGKDEDGM